MKHGDGGKGDAQRPTNHKSFSENFDKIFGKKETTLDTNPATRAWYTIDELNEKFGDDEDDSCSWCGGCGEGMYDGAACKKCKGTGIEPVEKDDDV